MTNVMTKTADPPSPMPWALSIPDAARMVGMSKAQFRRVFLDSGRLQSIHSGKRDRVIDTAELRAAYEAFVSDVRRRQ